MGWWNEHVVPRLVDRSLSAPPIGRLRAEICRGLQGRVLDLGAGSGPNLPYLPREVSALDAVEPSELAWRRLTDRAGDATVPVQRIGLDGDRIDLTDASVDGVLITFVLCTVPDPVATLAEVRRVLRPGGRVHLLEHGRAPDPAVVRRQQRWEPVQRRVAGGCHLTRDPLALLGDAGFETDWAVQGYLDDAPRFAWPWVHLTRTVAARP